MQNYDLLIERIAKSSGIDKEEIEKKVEAKKAKLSGLISKEGAAQIIAAELGINFEDQDLKISELMPGMRKVNTVGKVIKIIAIREFERNGKVGKVANLQLADETGSCRVVLWDTNQIALFENEEIKEGDVIKIKNGSTRDNEIHLSGFSEIGKVNIEIKEVKTTNEAQEKEIFGLSNNEKVKIRGIIVQIFPMRFYHVCPKCNKKVNEEDNFTCPEHAQIQPLKRGILNLVIDDGSECIRSVLFSDAINQISDEKKLAEDDSAFGVLKEDLLGSEVYAEGVVRKNALFNNLELIINSIKKVDVEKLIEELESN